MLQKALATIRLLGFKSLTSCILKKGYFHLLRLVFRFNPWHASAPFECRPYKAQVVTLVNSLRPHKVVEIGCGLGEILVRVNSVRRVGIDSDEKVIDAARFLNGSMCDFLVGDIADADLLGKLSGEFDVLVLINFAHGMRWERLSSWISEIVVAWKVTYVLIDTILPGIPGYTHYHSHQQLSMLGEVVLTTTACDGVRRFNIVKVITQ